MNSATINERLEELRLALGLQTYQQFLDRLNKRADEPFPYATARRYHRDGEPSLSYILQVARTFGVSLDWLLEGRGAMMAAARSVPEIESRSESGVPHARTLLMALNWSPGPTAVFRDLWRRYLEGFEDEVPEYLVTAMGLYLWQFVLLPFRHGGFRKLDDMKQRELDDYLQAMIGALGLAMPDPGQGDRLSKLGGERLWGFQGKLFWEEDGTDLPYFATQLLPLIRSIWEEEFDPTEQEDVFSSGTGDHEDVQARQDEPARPTERAAWNEG